MDGMANPSKLPIVPSVGVPVKLIRHDKGVYKVIGIPKSAAPRMAVKEVLMLVGVPQLGVTLVIEAKRWVEKRNLIYYITRKPYSEYLTQLASQGIREIVLYQIIPK